MGLIKTFHVYVLYSTHIYPLRLSLDSLYLPLVSSLTQSHPLLLFLFLQGHGNLNNNCTAKESVSPLPIQLYLCTNPPEVLGPLESTLVL